MERITLYLAGPMTGLPDDNRPAFNAAAKALEDAGYEVINPALLPEGWPREESMRSALRRLMGADAVALLPGWAESQRALVEMQVARAIDLKVASVSNWLDRVPNAYRQP